MNESKDVEVDEWELDDFMTAPRKRTRLRTLVSQNSLRSAAQRRPHAAWRLSSTYAARSCDRVLRGSAEAADFEDAIANVAKMSAKQRTIAKRSRPPPLQMRLLQRPRPRGMVTNSSRMGVAKLLCRVSVGTAWGRRRVRGIVAFAAVLAPFALVLCPGSDSDHDGTAILGV